METKHLNIDFGKYSTQIPYVEINGKYDGPSIFISAGIHGDEINGIHLVKDFLKWSKKEKIEEKLHGKITVLPVVNISGFQHMQRRVYEDNIDLNRAFGHQEIETYSHEIARVLTEEIFKKCKIGIDCHDSGGRSVLIPHTRVHKCEPLNCETFSKEMGQLFGTKIILERNGNENMLAIYLKDKYDISVLTVEIGGAQTIFHDYIDKGLQGIKNILIGMQMIKGDIIVPQKQFLLHDRYGIVLNNAAEINFDKKLGDFVKKGEKICDVYYPDTMKSEEFVCHDDGIIFSRWQFNQVPSNQIIFSILDIDKNDNILNQQDRFDELKSFDIKNINL